MEDREIEVKILDIDLPKIVSKLKEVGAKKIKDVIYRRLILDFDDGRLDKEHSWIRIRTEGVLTTLTYKKKLNSEMDGKEEVEIEVSDYNTARKLMEKIGLKVYKEQESRRVMYNLDGAEVNIDMWPRVPVYLEVEAESVEKVKETLNKLGLDGVKYNVMTGRELFKHYNVELHDFDVLKLEQEKKDLVIE